MFEQIEATEQKIEQNEVHKQEIESSRQSLENSISKVGHDLEVVHSLEKNVKEKQVELDKLNQQKEEYANELRNISSELETKMLDAQRDIGGLIALERETGEDFSEALAVAESNLSWVTDCQDKIKELDEKYHLNLFPKPAMVEKSYTPHAKIQKLQFDIEVDESKFNREIYEDQVFDFEGGLNSLNVYDFIQNYENYEKKGRGSSEAQQQYRYTAIEGTVADRMLADPSLTYEKTREEVKKEFSGLAALHLPDQKVGGFPDLVHSLGDSSINSSIGGAFTRKYSKNIYEHVLQQSKFMSIEEQKNTYLNISLNIKSKIKK